MFHTGPAVTDMAEPHMQVKLGTDATCEIRPRTLLGARTLCNGTPERVPAELVAVPKAIAHPIETQQALSMFNSDAVLL